MGQPNVKYQSMRRELELHLEDILEIENTYRINKDNFDYNTFMFDQLIHFFFDDTELYEDSTQCIGLFLGDEREAELASLLSKKLNDLIGEGQDLSPLIELIVSEHWEKVVEYANLLLQELRKSQ